MIQQRAERDREEANTLVSQKKAAFPAGIFSQRTKRRPGFSEEKKHCQMRMCLIGSKDRQKSEITEKSAQEIERHKEGKAKKAFS